MNSGSVKSQGCATLIETHSMENIVWKYPFLPAVSLSPLSFIAEGRVPVLFTFKSRCYFWLACDLVCIPSEHVCVKSLTVGCWSRTPLLCYINCRVYVCAHVYILNAVVSLVSIQHTERESV